MLIVPYIPVVKLDVLVIYLHGLLLVDDARCFKRRTVGLRGGGYKAHAGLCLPGEVEIVAIYIIGIVQLFLYHPVLDRIVAFGIRKEVEDHGNLVGVGVLRHRCCEAGADFNRVGIVLRLVCLHIAPHVIRRAGQRMEEVQAAPVQRFLLPVPVQEQLVIRIVINENAVAQVRFRVLG